MKKILKVAMVASGFVLAVAASATKSKAENASQTVALPGEGCRDTGDCGTTPAGTKLNGSYTVWN